MSEIMEMTLLFLLEGVKYYVTGIPFWNRQEMNYPGNGGWA